MLRLFACYFLYAVMRPGAFWGVLKCESIHPDSSGRVVPLLKQLSFPIPYDTDADWHSDIECQSISIPSASHPPPLPFPSVPTYAAKFDLPPVPHIE